MGGRCDEVSKSQIATHQPTLISAGRWGRPQILVCGLLADGTDVVGAVGAFLPGGRKFKVIQWCDFGLGGLLFGGWLVIGISSHREGVVGSKSSSKMF